MGDKFVYRLMDKYETKYVGIETIKRTNELVYKLLTPVSPYLPDQTTQTQGASELQDLHGW